MLSVFQGKVLRRIFGPKRDKVKEEWIYIYINIYIYIYIYNEELNDLYSSPNIIRVIKSRRIRWGWLQQM